MANLAVLYVILDLAWWRQPCEIDIASDSTVALNGVFGNAKPQCENRMASIAHTILDHNLPH